MSRKHFRLIADAMQQLRTFEAEDRDASEVVQRAVRFSSVVDALASALASTNGRFDRQRFIAACNGKAGR